jgi:hypothetical protein
VPLGCDAPAAATCLLGVDVSQKVRHDCGVDEGANIGGSEPWPWRWSLRWKRELPDAAAAYAKTGSGKALARESDRLDTAARHRGVTPLTSQLSESHAALAAQLRAEGFDPAKMRLPPEQWFVAADGLRTVRALAEHVAANLNAFKQPNPILRDLKAAEALLVAAEAAGVRFHFTKTSL